MKDIIITAGGKNITPSEIENQLKFSPYISDAVVIGDKRAYLTCLS
jgi:long-chain acyl-CoA synthetase